MTQGSYRQFCPVAMAAEVLCRRWTIVLLRELVAGSTRFNDLRRGVPRMSPALLSQRLKELETAGILYRKRSPADPDVFEYCLTDAGRELRPIVEAFGMWGQRLCRCGALATASRRVAAYVGHAAQPRSHAATAAAQCHPVPIPGSGAGAAFMVASGRTGCRGGSLFRRSRVRCRPLCLDRSAHHDSDLDGVRKDARWLEQRKVVADRCPTACQQHADMAGAQPICEKAPAAERTGLLITGISPTYFVA